MVEEQPTNVLPPLPVVGVEVTPTPSGKVEIRMFDTPTPTPTPSAEDSADSSNKELAAPKISGPPEEPPKGEKGQKLNLGEMALKPTTAGQPTKFVVGKKNGKNECLVMIPTGVFDVTHCSPVSVMIQFQDCESGALGEKIEGLSRFVCKKKPMQLRFYYRHTLFVGTLKKTSNDKEKSKSYDVSKIDVFRFGVIDKTTGVIPGAVQNENIQKLPNAAEEVLPEDLTVDGSGSKPDASASPSPSPSPRD